MAFLTKINWNSRLWGKISLIIAYFFITGCVLSTKQVPEVTRSQFTSIIETPTTVNLFPSSTTPPKSTTPPVYSTPNPIEVSTEIITKTINTQTPTITLTFGPIGQLHLKTYDLVMDYKRSRWQEDKPDEYGRKVLTHTIFSNCQIREFGPAHILGEFIDKFVLGQHMFSVYEYIDEKEDGEVLVRQYVIDRQITAPKQTPAPTPVDRPLFLVFAPKLNPEPCFVSAQVVLATLHKPLTP